MLDDAAPIFRDGSSVSDVGVLLAIPCVIESALVEISRELYGEIGQAFYDLRNDVTDARAQGAAPHQAAWPFWGSRPTRAIQAQNFYTPSYSEAGTIPTGYALAFGSHDATDSRSELGAHFDRVVAVYSDAALAWRRVGAAPGRTTGSAIAC